MRNTGYILIVVGLLLGARSAWLGMQDWGPVQVEARQRTQVLFGVSATVLLVGAIAVYRGRKK